jgi:mono/diheme cytochrome c family protein
MKYFARFLPNAFALALLGGLEACSSASPPPAAPQLAIVASSGEPLHAVAGDSIALKVVVLTADGTMAELPSGARVTWSAPLPVVALSSDSTAASPLPVAGGDPIAAWVSNPGRPDEASALANVLFVLDPGTGQNGTVAVSATVTGATPAGKVTASIGVDPAPVGDWNRGAELYGAAGVDCAECHGATGHGSPGAPDATSFTIAGGTYDYPAPGLNAEPGNAAGDPAWNVALFAFAARSDVDNGGLTLRQPMPSWQSKTSPITGKVLSTQDFADIFAFLKTQSQ